MNKRTIQLAKYLSIFTCLFILAFNAANAQQDSSEFKLIPKYYPEKDYDKVPPPELAFAPKVVFPTDPNLQDREATVIVKLLVTTGGIVREAKIGKSTDPAFNKYALKYAKQLKFKWTDKPGSLKKVWVAYPIHFKH